MRVASLICVAAACLLGGASVARSAEPPPPGGTPREYRLPTAERISLPNGLQATLVPFGVVPKVTIAVVVRTGNIDERGATWLADLTGALLREGTATRNARQVALEAAQMGGGVGVNVGMDTTTVSIDVLAEHGPRAVALLGELLLQPALPESEIERSKRDLLRNLSVSRSQPGAQASEAFLGGLYGDHPYGRIFPDESELAGYDSDDVNAFYSQNFGARRAQVYVTGQFDVERMRTAIRSALVNWAPGPPPVQRPVQPIAGLRVVLVDRPGAAQSTIRLGVPVPRPNDATHVPLLLTNTILGGYFSSRITANIREDKGYTYSPRSGVRNRAQAAHWVQSADVTTAVTGPAIREILAEVDGLRAAAPNADELQRAKNYRTGAFVLSNATRSGLISQLAFLDLHGLDLAYLSNYVSNVHQVTAKQVQEIARDLLDPAKMLLVVVGDVALVEPQLRAVPALADLQFHRH